MDKASIRSVLPYAVGLAVAVALYLYAGTIVYSSRPGQLGPDLDHRLDVALLRLAHDYALERRPFRVAELAGMAPKVKT